MLDFLLSYLLLYKYLALFLINFFAAIALPLPASATLIAAGSFAAQGYLDIYSVMLASYAGTLLGDWGGYFLSLKFGKDILKKIGFRHILQSEKFLTTEKKFEQNSGTLIFFSRFLITVLGPTVNVLSGLYKIQVWKYILAESLGELLYVLIYASTGYLFTETWQNLSDILQNISFILAIIILLVWLIRTGFKNNHRKI